MNLLTRFSRLSRSAMLGVALLVATSSPLAFAQSAPTADHTLTAQAKNRILTRVQDILQRYAFVPGVSFDNWPDVINQYQPDIDKAQNDVEFVSVVNEALHKYGMSHTNLFTPSFGHQRQTQEKPGLGIKLEPYKGGLRIVSVIAGGAAEKAGLQPGDVILTCDGKTVKGIEDLAGEVDQTSIIQVQRVDKDNKSQTLSFSVTRKVFSTAVPETLVWKGDDAVITIPSFDKSYDHDRVDSLMTQAMKAKSLVVDLRGNGGGSVLNLLHFLSFFLEPQKEPIGEWVSADAVKAYEKDNPPTKDVRLIAKYSDKMVTSLYDKPRYSGKVAVLINGGTGSASEMFAAGMRELRSAPLVGTRSAGAVLASILREIDGGEGFWIQYPLLDYVTTKGVRLEGTGLTPDVVAQTPRFGEQDKALSTAINLLDTGVALSH